MAGLLEALASFVTEIDWDAVPEKEKAWARLAFCDFTAVAMAGAGMPVAQNVRKFLAARPTVGRSVLMGSPERTDAASAALFNGTASHALDYDDVSWTTIGHPTVSVAPAALACAQEVGADGRTMLLSYVAGVEVMHQIARWTMPALSERGWHTTPAYGVFGVAAAAALAYGATKDETVHALAIAASRAGGVRGNFGTQTKALHAGLSASMGIECAKLARCGVTGSPDVIEKADGFAQCFADALQDAKTDIGVTWDLAEHGLVLKQYPCCSGSHPANDVWDAFVRERGLCADDIERIEAGVSLLSPRELNCHRPQDAVAAKFSLEYALASRVVFGPIGIALFTDEKVRDARVQALMAKVKVAIDPELARLGFIGTAPVRLKVVLKTGEEVRLASDLAEGNPEKPLSEVKRRRKFEDCLRHGGAEAQIEPWWRALQAVDEADADFVVSLGGL